MLDQRLNDSRKAPQDQPGLRNVMNRVEAEITVQVDGLRREFDSKEGKVVALDGVNLQVRKGEIFGVLGPNGAGKTTMIRILSTLLLPTSGKAGAMGFDVAKEPEKIRAVINMASGAERAEIGRASCREGVGGLG